MSDITVVTPPDVYVTDLYSILLIHPNVEVKQAVSNIMESINNPIVIYLYELADNLEVPWLMDAVQKTDLVFIDVDNCSPIVRNLASYIIGKPKTFYLTNDSKTPYNIINHNRVYDFNWLESTIKRGLNEI